MNSAYAEQILAAEQARLQSYLFLFSITFLYWDHILTLSDELLYFWRRPVGASTILFFLNRYFAALGNIALAISLFSGDFTESSCGSFHTFHELLLVATQVIICMLLAIRIYALYNCSKRILALILSTGGILSTLSLFAIFFDRSEGFLVGNGGLGLGCETELSFIPSIQEAAAWEALFLYDSMLFVMTLHKAYKTHRELRPLRIPLMDIILRDGSLYFGVMAFANAVNISTFYYPLPYARGMLSSFASSMSVTMMSRLMFNLHKVADKGLFSSGPYSSDPTSYCSGSQSENLTVIATVSEAS
ncbi:hypothetical protein GYMLUDRAFT_47148 [Collybiopsis luxurians FD-317 M1]|uniref:DUF6533 domain-containing protein n=1 Tax=Collybiopsis luxurians FD-317 M1 TaxID=944289 RepID=A0A0D0CE99_9AGAR|nr:hypothetical protein GYMLUDRAFT_47148 [Collybiopsis luxurians FD-317 M1]